MQIGSYLLLQDDAPKYPTKFKSKGVLNIVSGKLKAAHMRQIFYVAMGKT